MTHHKNINILTWFNFFTDFKLYAPIAILYFAQITGSFAAGMTVFAITMISSALLEIPTGVLSDTLGRKRTLVLGAISAALSIVFYSTANGFWVLCIGGLCEGLSRALYSGNNEALLHDTLSQAGQEEDFAHYAGKTGSMFQIALATSGVLGGLISIWSMPLVLWLSLPPQLVCIYLATQCVEPRTRKHREGSIYTHIHQAFKLFKTNKKLRLLSVSSVLSYGLGEASYQFQAAFYAMLWPTWAISVAKTASNIGASLSFYYSGKTIKKAGAITMLLVSNLYGRIISLIAAAIPTALSPILITTSSLFFGIGTVASSTLFQKEFKDEYRATMGSLNSFAGSVFFGIIAIITGVIADASNPAIAFLYVQIAMLPIIFLNWKIYRQANY